MRVLGLAVSVILLSFFQPSVETLTARPPTVMATQVIGTSGEDDVPVSAAPSSDFLKWAITQGGVTVVALGALYLLYTLSKGQKEDKDRLISTLEKNAVAMTECTTSNNRLVAALERKGI